MKIINKYILKTFVSNLSIYFFITVLLLLLNYLYQLIFSFLTHKAEITAITKLFFLLLPSIISIALPVAFLLSLILTLSVLNETRELITIQTMGIKYSFYLSNFFIAGIILSVFMIYFNSHIVPKSYNLFRQQYIKLVISKPYINFYNNQVVTIQNKKIVAKNVLQNNNIVSLNNVYIVNPDEKYDIIQTIYAKDANVFFDIYNNTILDLHNGTCLIFNKNNFSELTFLKFTNYKFIIYSHQLSSLISKKTTFREMTNKELINEFYSSTDINYKKHLLSEYYLRYTIAISILTFTIVGICLGLRIKYNARPLSFIATILTILVYYFMLTACISIVERAKFVTTFTSANIVMQLPNFILSVISVFLLPIKFKLKFSK